MSSNPYTYWTALADDELTVDNVSQAIGSIPDDLWAVAAIFDRVIDNVEVQQTLLELGIARTAAALGRSKKASSSLLRTPSGTKSPITFESSSIGSATQMGEGSDKLHTYFLASPHDAQLCTLRAALLHRLDRLNTFLEISKLAPSSSNDEVEEEIEEEIEEWEDDPWADNVVTPSSITNHNPKTPTPLPISLKHFLVDDLLETSRHLASSRWFRAVQLLLQRHYMILWPFRFYILESVPEHAHPSDLQDILPAFDALSSAESLPVRNPWRPSEDWSETTTTQTALHGVPLIIPAKTIPSGSLNYPPAPAPVTADELSIWYKQRVDTIIKETSLFDVALATIQYAASKGIPGLEETGEELSLLSRLIYDAPQGPNTDDWSLDRWSSMEPSAIVRAYLAHSTPLSLPKDISHLVLPYLFVLEARAERAGKPDPELHNRLLHEFILSKPLETTATIFEASKPTLPAAQRLIRDDTDLVRVALACLYGSQSIDQWSTMSRIFECLPAWDVAMDVDHNQDAADTTLSSLGAFVTPSTGLSHCSASDLLVFFTPLPLSSLSRVLDILDVHLEAGEIMARWSVPAPLRWFLQSSNDINEQRARANRMARRAGGLDDQLSTPEDWDWLLEDMLKLTGKSDTGIPNAFSLLAPNEVVHLFFGGLLSSGKFDIAKTLLRSSAKISIGVTELEKICLECSREFYDNAQSGNYKFGDMKLAYECLDVPTPTESIIREKEFIEATSRISSFNVTSRPGIPMSPIEIRLTNDRLSLVSRVLSSNNDAYKHTEVILDLVHKLGFKNDVTAEVKTFAMLADTALQAEDFTRAYEISERMVNTVLDLRVTSLSAGLTNSPIMEAREVCWVACFQLGRQPEFGDLEKKLFLLGRALELCPPDKLYDVLASWRRLDKEDIEAREQRLSSNPSAESAASHKRTLMPPENVAASLRARLQEFHMPSPPLLSTPDAAALASRTFRSVAANFPFSVGHRGRSQVSEQEEEGSFRGSHGDDVSAQATRALSKGIGWLIGTDDQL